MLWPPGDSDVAGAVPVGVATSNTPVPFAVLVPEVVLVVAGAAR